VDKVMLKIVLVSAPRDKAEGIARKLLEERLAACVNILPAVESLYWWEGRIQKDAEALLILKVPTANVPALLEGVGSWHPYQVPEVLVLDIAQGHGPYIASALREGSRTEKS
jgi:periplasmic divalent cation tolerance protein